MLLLVLFTAACASPEATIQLGGSLNVLPAKTTINITDFSTDWVHLGHIPDAAVATSQTLGKTTLSITSATSPYVLARRVKANLLATPYLSWNWRLSPGKWQYHPVRIVVGFADKGTPGDAFLSANALPPHDRILSFLWAPSALMRGSFIDRNNDKRSHLEAGYVVRGGPENVGIWWLETVDLAQIHEQAWPLLKVGDARLSFIGIASAASPAPATAYVSDLRLSR